MKKFMIFLLMAFLYLGTCQARSEATHFNNANVKLHSWVMPATSHAFIMDSKSVYGEPIVKVSPSQPQNLCLTCPLNKATFAVSFEENGSGESEASRVWLVNGHPTDSTGTTFTFSGYAAGHYTVACRVTTDAGYTYTSNYVEITVDVDAIVNIVGPDQACLNDVVTLTAQVENSSLECSYQWRRDGQYIVGATNPSYSFLVSELPGLTDTLVYEFDVQITRAGCDSKYSPVHYFMVAPTPVPQVDVPLFCAGSPVTLTGNAYTAGSIQPYMWKWINTTTNDTTVTYVNTMTIANPISGDVYKVIPIYQDYACNADTAEVTLVSYQDSLHITELQDLTLIATPDTVCLDGMAQLKVNDPNKTNAALGEVSYTWYMNGTPVSGVTDSIYTATLSNTGTYTFKAVASYANYPCATAEDTVEVVVDTVPASVVITGNNILCQSGDAAYNSTTLTAEVTPSTGTYQYKWTGDTDFGTEHTKDISLPGVYAVIVKTAGGCETMSLPIQVYGFGADVQITSTQTTCAGQPVTLNVNADGWTSNVTYLWDNNQTTSTINVTPTADTWYKVTSTAHLTDGTTCTRTDSIQVLVLSAPTAPEVATKDNTICQDSLVTIYVKNAVDGTHYTWYQNGIELPGFNLDTISVELNTPGTYTFAAAVVSPNGCVSAASTAVTITVEAAPTLLTITGTDVICEGSQATLTAHAEGVAATDPYSWSTSDKTYEIQVGAGTYAVTAYSDNGCAVSAEYTVHSLGSDVQLTASTTEVCAGQSVTLNVNVDGWGEGNISYEWAGVTNGAHSNHVTVTPTESGYYKVTTTVTSTAGTCSRVDSIYITVIKVSVSDVAFIGPDTICVGSQATMTAVSNGANYFVWYENGVQIPGENLDTIRVMPTEPGSYIYSVAAVSNGCVSKDTTLQPELLVLGNPTVEITGDPIICNDSTIHLIAIINDTLNTNANGASYTYEWRLYNNTLTNGSNTVDGVDYDFVINADTLETEVHSQDHPYIFTVTAYNENGCAATSEPYNVYVGNDIEVAVTVDRDTVCKGGMVTATAHLGDYNMSNLVYNWYIVTEAAGYTDTTWIADATSITYTASVEENLKIGVKVTQTTTGCTIMGDTTVTVFNPEIISVIVSNETFNDGSDFTVCEGEEVYVTAYIEDETTGAKIIDSSLIYVWYENGILLQGVDGPTFHKQLSILDEDTANYVYSVFIDFGVEGCLPKPVASNKVHVNRNPIVTIAGHHNVCYFGPYEETGYHNVHLIAWVNGDYNPDFTYTWYEHGQERYSVAGSIYDNHYTETWIPTFDNPHVFTVMVSDSNGCTTLSEPFEVNVYNKPVVNITASETTICDGGQSILTAHLDNYNDPNLIYQWYTNTTEPDNMIPGMTELTETFMPEDTTTYIIKVTHLLENGTLNAQACFSLATMTINVNDDPVIDSVTSDLAEGNDTICEGRYVTFTAHISGGVAGGEIFTWYRNGEIIPGAVDSVYRETPQAVNGDITVYDYAVSVRQTASGCESNVTPADTITVYPNPVLVLVTDPIVCDTMTDNIVMYANVTPAPTSSYNFTWYEDNAEITDGTLSGTHNDTIKITRPYRDYEYSFAVELVNDYGCTVRDEATVHVNDNPIVHATVTEDSICVGGLITLTANLDDYNADMLEFHWYDNGVLIGTATELTYTTVPTLGEHKYNMTALQRNSLCIASSDTVVVNVMADPIIDSVTTDLAEGNDTICEGRFVTLTAHISGGVTGGEIFTWYRNGEIIPGAVDSVYQETPQAENGDPTTYDYTVTVRQTASGCESDVNGYNTITVLPNPVLELVTDPIVCDTLENNIVMYANVTPAPTSSYSFTWYEDNQVLADGTMMGEHNDSIKLTRPYRDYPYSFSVELVNAYGCTVRDDATIYVNDNPIVHATVTDDTLCIGGEITLTANLDDYNADMLEFHWYDNGQLIGTATELTYTTVPTLGEHRYNMTALQRNSLCIASSDTVVVLVKPDPVISQVVLSDYIACEGAQVRVEAIADSTTYTPSATDVYTWYRNGIRIPGATNRVLFDTPVTVDQNTQQFVYTAVVTLEEPGCTSLPVSASALTIYRNPVVAISGDQHVCETDYTFLIANVDTVGMNVGNLHYTWFINGDIRDNNAYNLGDNRFFAEYLYPRDEPYIFTVTVERGDIANACASTSAPYEVYVYPKPEVNITGNVTDICENGAVTLQANLNDYNADNMTFQWYEVRNVTSVIAIDYLPGGGYVYDTIVTQYNYNIPGATGFRYTTTLTETTTLGVIVTQTTSQCYDIDEFTVTVHPTPPAPIIAVNHEMICSNGDVDLTITNDYSEYGTPIYAWMMDGQIIPGAFGPAYHQEPGLTSGTIHSYNAIVAFEMPGCISVASDTAEVHVIPDPVVTVTVDGPTTICEGGSVTFSANAQPTTLDYTYDWYDYNNQLIADAHDSTLTVSPSANQQDYQYVVVVNSLPGCQIVVNAPVVTVVTDPVVTLSIDNPIICQGGQSTLTVDVQGGIAGQNGIDPYSYAWYSNNNTETPFAVTNTNFYVLPTNLETDSFAYWVEVSANTYGCATTSAHVNQLVVADPIVNIIVAPTYPETVCDGGNTMLVATVQGGFGENSYQWYRNETILVGETNPTLNTGILSVNDINSYRVIVTQTGSGCETVSDTFQVPVIPTYDVVVSALNNATVCEGGTTTMEATITNTILPNDNPTFQWYEIIDGANVAIAGANSTRYTTSPLLTDGNHTYFVAVTSQITGSGCSSHSNSFYTSIVDDPVVTVTTTAINNVVCEGDVVHVNATVAPAGGNYTYNWTWTNGTNTYTYTNNEPTFAPTDLPASINGYLFNVSIVSTDANSGCNATSNNNAYVTVMPRPVVTITADNEVVCAGGHVVLTANHNASDYTGFNYAWTINGTNMASTLQTITVPASMVTAGTINASVIVTSSQLTLNCTSTASLTQPVQVLAQPTISLSADHLTMCAGAAPTLTATVNGNSINTPMTFVWKRNGSIINGATGSVYQSEPLNAGTYNFQVMALSENTDLNCNSDWSADNAVVVRVAETPVVSIASADGTLDLCEGGNITLTATVINANNTIGDFTNGSIYGAYNYVWNRDNNVVATNNNITLPQNQITETLNTYGYYTYNVNLTPVGALAFGCGSVMAENPVVVNVHLRPNWDAAVVSAHDGNICLGEEVQLHAHITGGVADMNGNTNGHIQWVVEFNGVASNVSNYGGDATHTPTVPGVYTYYPTYVAYEGSIIGSGCAFTSSNDQVSTFVTVHALPTAAFVSGDGSIICANVSDDNAALTIHFTGTPPFHFTVDDLSNGTSVMYDSYTNDYVIYVNPNHTTQYRITYLSDNYCSNGELGLDAIATIFVNDIQFEETFFQAECGEDVVTISFNMLSGTPNSDFTVTYDNGMVVNGTISNNTATFATPSIPGDYHAVFTVGGCDYDIIVRRPVGVNDFSDGSTPFMMQRWDDVVIINNNPATNGGHTFVSYQWYRNGVAIPGAIYKNYQEIGGLNGYYSIEVVSQDADGRTVTYRTCDQFFSSSSAIRVYPVPANVQQVVTVEIDMTAEELEGATLDIYDVTGSLVEHVTTVDPVTYLSGFKASGTYFGRLMMANGETKTVKFVIVK